MSLILLCTGLPLFLENLEVWKSQGILKCLGIRGIFGVANLCS